MPNENKRLLSQKIKQWIIRWITPIIGAIAIIIAALIPLILKSPDFVISVNPVTGRTLQGSMEQAMVKIKRIRGYKYPVALSTKNQHPAIKVTFIPKGGPTPPYNSTMEIKVDSDVSIGEHTIIIEIIGGDGKEHTCRYILSVELIPVTEETTPEETTTDETTEEKVKVIEVEDGDTIDVNLNGKIKTIRYIGISTPEKGESCYDEATQANYSLVYGKTVTLVKDITDTDKYGRLLRYVYVDDTFVNAYLVKNGWAEATFYRPDIKYSGDFAALEKEAKENNRGFWAIIEEKEK